MKLFFTLILFLVVSCKSAQNATNTTLNSNKILEIKNCTENFECKLELLPNKTLIFNTDEFGNVYALVNDGENIILKYTYNKKPNLNIADDNYTEIIYAELPKNISNLHLTNQALQTVKLHFGRFCYCKGNTGYFPITEGEFTLTKLENNQLKIELNFSLKKVPHKVTIINQEISLK